MQKKIWLQTIETMKKVIPKEELTFLNNFEDYFSKIISENEIQETEHWDYWISKWGLVHKFVKTNISVLEKLWQFEFFDISVEGYNTALRAEYKRYKIQE